MKRIQIADLCERASYTMPNMTTPPGPDPIEVSLDAAGIATWTLHISEYLVTTSPRIRFWFDLMEMAETAPVEFFVGRIHLEDQARVREELSGHLQSPEMFEVDFRVTGADGKARWLLARSAPQKSETGVIERRTGALIDITLQKEAEAALRAEQEKLKLFIELTPANICILRGPEMRYEYANESYLKLVGRKDLVGKPLLEALPEVADQGFMEILTAVYTTGKPFVGHGLPVKLKPPSEAEALDVFVDVVYQPIIEADGTISGILTQSIDNTEQVLAQHQIMELNAELEKRVEDRTAALIAQNQELEGFTYSVSHDLRAPLRAIVAETHFLQEDEGPRLSEAGRQNLKRLSKAALHVSVLVDDLLQFARLGKKELSYETFSIDDLAEEVANVVRGDHPEAELVLESRCGQTIAADRRIVGMALQNLFDNSVKYRKKDSSAKVRFSFKDGAYCFEDQGIGFDMKYVHKLFLPFERLHRDQYVGTGIGLANVKRAIERHGGKVWAEGEIGKGAKFWFTLS
jgi:signal transduction histidine kinase